MGKFKPDRVVNCAAMHNLQACERDPLQAFKVNAEGALNVAKECAAAGAFNVYVSTDYVFGGDAEPRVAVREWEPPNPRNVYGWTKATGEFLTRRYSKEYAVLRTAYLYGKVGPRQKGGMNLVTYFFRAAREQARLEYASDTFFSTANAADVAKMALDVNTNGTFHAVNPGIVTPFEFVLQLAAVSGIKVPIVGVRSPADNLRPRNTGLHCSFPGTRKWKEAVLAFYADNKAALLA